MLKKFCLIFFLFFFLINLWPTLSYSASCEPKVALSSDDIKTSANSLFVKTTRNFFNAGSWIGLPGFCWGCPFYRITYTSISNLVNSLAKTLRTVFLTLLGIGLLFSILFYFLKHVAQFQGMEFGAFLSEILRHFGKALLVISLIWSVTGIFEYLIEPILNLALSFAGELQTKVSSNALFSGGNATFGNIDPDQAKLLDFPNINTVCSDLCASRDSLKSASFLGVDTCNNLTGLICKISSSIIVGFVISVCLLTLSFEKLIPNFSLLLTGLIMIFAYGSLLFKIPLILLDSTIRIGFICAIAPLLLVLWLFEASKEYVKGSFKIFLTSCLNFIFVSLVVIFIIQFLTLSLGVDFEKRNLLLSYLIRGCDSQAVDSLEPGFLSPIWTSLACYFSFKLLEVAATLSDYFAFVPGSFSQNTVGKKLSSTIIRTGGIGVKAAKAAPFVAGYALGKASGLFNKDKPIEMGALKAEKWARSSSATSSRNYREGWAGKRGARGVLSSALKTVTGTQLATNLAYWSVQRLSRKFRSGVASSQGRGK